MGKWSNMVRGYTYRVLLSLYVAFITPQEIVSQLGNLGFLDFQFLFIFGVRPSCTCQCLGSTQVGFAS